MEPPAPSASRCSSRSSASRSSARPRLANRAREPAAAARSVRLATLVAPAGYGKTTLLASGRRATSGRSCGSRSTRGTTTRSCWCVTARRVRPSRAPRPRRARRARGAGAVGLGGRGAAAGAAVISRRTLRGRARRRRHDRPGRLGRPRRRARRARPGRLDARRRRPVGAGAANRPAPASGRLLELGREELALSRRDSLLLVRGAGVELDDERASDLATRSEGWAAGLYLATRALDDVGPGEAHGVGRRRRPLPDRLLLVGAPVAPERGAAGVPAPHVRCSSGCRALCDAVLEREGSAAELASIERAGLLLVPLDRQGGWYRYHRLFRERSGASWSTTRRRSSRSPCPGGRLAGGHGDPEGRCMHVRACGDADRAGGSSARSGSPARRRASRRWSAGSSVRGRRALETQPARRGTRRLGLRPRGRPEDAERWLAGADRLRRRAVGRIGVAAALVALVTGGVVCDGTGQMGRDAETRSRTCPAESAWRPTALVLEGRRPGAAESSRTTPTRRSPPPAGAAPRRRRRRRARHGRAGAPRGTAGDQSAAERLALQAREVAASDPVEEHAGRAVAHAVAARSSATAAGTRRATPSMRPTASRTAVARVAVARGPGAGGARGGPRHPARPRPARSRSSPSASGSSRPARPGLARERGRGPATASRGLPALGEASTGLTRRRASPPAAPGDASLVPRDRRPALRLAEHDQDPGDLGVPQARRLEPQRRDRAGVGGAGEGGWLRLV